MAAARKELLELETARHAEQAAELDVANAAIAGHMAEASQRAASADMAREVLVRLSQQPSAVQAAARLASIISPQRRGE
jgi:hypothetical protein